MQPIYLDFNATTPIADEVAEAMLPYLYQHFGNPSSTHPYGVMAKKAIENARFQAASLLGCQPYEVIFTSGGTESNNYAIRGVALAYRKHGNHIITSAVEHPAVLEVCRDLEKQGFRLTILDVDEEGMVNPSDLEEVITADTILVSVMHANNEVGTIQPIWELARIAHRYGALIHCDAAQSVGKILVNVKDLEVDLLSVAGHKLYAPKGVGLLFAREGVQLTRLMHGAGHEFGRRPGTENVLEIVGLGQACLIAGRDLEKNTAHMKKVRDRLHEGIIRGLGSGDLLKLNGHPEQRLPNTLSLSFRGIEANTLLSEIGDRVAASAGAACHADSVEVSHVLQAMKVPLEWAMGTVRFSVGRETTSEEVERAAEIVVAAVKRLSPSSQVAGPVAVLDGGDYKLTQYTHGLGCACKLRPQVLEDILKSLPLPEDASVLVGTETADDAAVYRLDDETAIVATVDFFTPIVDDPYWFGAISAANSLSDIYAMGARPLFALNVVGFPSNRLPMKVLELILKGALDKAAEAGIPIIGGHTVDDTEPKFGLAVTGLVHPQGVLRNSTTCPGDALVLTKPLGIGIISTAIKRGLASAEETEMAIQTMAALNRQAAEVMLEVGVNACTDITGFGLLGHLHEMAVASQVDVIVSASKVPMLPTAKHYAGSDVLPGGTLDNLAYVQPFVSFSGGISRLDQLMLSDAQTSGGLLISLPAERLDLLLEKLHKRGVDQAAEIGRIIAEGSGHIFVEP